MSVATAVGCRSGRAASVPTVPVVIAAAEQVDAPITIDASGVVAPTQTVNVESQVTGAVVGVAFVEGARVDSGAVLFHIDARALEAAADQAQSNLMRDLALADAATRDDTRYATLVKEDYVSKEQADQIHAAAVGARAVVKADSAALRTATVNLGFATLTAPIGGRVGKLIVHLGNVVGPSTGPLVVINKLRPIMVQFPILAQDLPLLRRAVAAHPLEVIAISSDTINSTETGRLSLLDNAIDSLTGTVTGQAIFPNDHALFWPGQLVALTIKAGVQQGAVAVPTEAVMTSQKGNYVFVVDPNARVAQMRNITSGRVVGAQTIVVSGIKSGEQVVVDGQSRLAPGAHVTIVPAPAIGDTASSTTLPNTPGAGSGTPAPTQPASTGKAAPAPAPCAIAAASGSRISRRARESPPNCSSSALS